MNIVLWVVQALLALVYLGAGGAKITQPVEKMKQRLPWVVSMSPAFVRFIGAAEVLGAIGLIVPLATNILPWLTPTAAGGLVLVQIGAAAFHTSRREVGYLPGNIILLVVAAFILIGRTALIPA